jgi:hypothetical protein
LCTFMLVDPVDRQQVDNASAAMPTSWRLFMHYVHSEVILRQRVLQAA